MVGVTLRGVSKSFGSTRVLHRVDADIEPGSFAVLVGPSGCGKSTLLRLIAGLEEVTTGTIHFGDRDVTALPPRDRDLAMVFQSYALYPHMTVRDNLAFGLRLRKEPPAVIRERVDEAAKMLGLIREITSAPIRYAIATHYHADHILGLQVFEGAGAEILGPTGSREYLEGLGKERLEERRFSLDPWVNDQTRLVWPTRWVESELKLELGGIQLTVTPQGAAHSKGDLTVYVEPDRVLFAGDLIFEGRTPFLGDANSRRWLENLEQMQTTGVAALVPGHGPAAMRPTEAIGATRDYLAYLREQMGAGVAELQGFDDTYSGVDWSRFANWPAFEEANRRNAYQVFLSMEAELFK